MKCSAESKRPAKPVRKTELEKFEAWRNVSWKVWPIDWTPEHRVCMWLGWLAAKRQAARERRGKP